MKHGSNLRHSHQLPTWLLLQVHVLLTSRSSWFIDSRVLVHMTGTPSTLSFLTPITTYPPVSIEDGHSCSVKGYGWTKPAPSLTLHNILYVIGFPTNLLSISTITRTLNCVTIFHPSIVSSMTSVAVIGLVWGVRMVMGSISSCRRPLPLGLLPYFLAPLLLLLFCGIVDLAIIVFLNLSEPYHGYL